jgi:outer membrane beta-barrel protein
MAGRIRSFLLTRAPALAAGCMTVWCAPGLAADAVDNQPQQVIQPEVERREIKEPKIDTEDFEVGIYGGVLSIEDFGSNAVVGARLAYHVTEGIFLEAAAGQSTAGKTSFETLSGSVQLLNDDDRKYTYYNVSVGYNILPGEVFIGSKWAFNSDLYVIGGIGNTRFAGDNHFTGNFGVGYRFLATDWLAIHIDVRDHIFKSDLLGTNKTTNNIEAGAGITFFF